MLTRRSFVRTLAAAASGPALSATSTLAQPAIGGRAAARVVVVGGGAGGATAAKYIGKDTRGRIEVTLVEPNPNFVSCFHSNLVIGGFKSLDQLTHPYGRLIQTHGLKVVHQSATKLDAARRRITLADGTALDYDRLIVSPGVDLDYTSVPGWAQAHEETMPHGWKVGTQTRLIMARLAAIPDGGLVIVMPPPMPYRCPPGPYERISMMAHVLKSTGRTRAKIIVLDAKASFSKQALFIDAWKRHYGDMVEWLSIDAHGGIKRVEPSSGTVITEAQTFRNSGLVNVIPKQHAGRIAATFGLTDATGWCPIDASTMKSTNHAQIQVLGDSAIAGDLPKSGFAANHQAKVAANVLRHELLGEALAAPQYRNTCWSLVGKDDCVKVGGVYEPKAGRITAVSTFISEVGEGMDVRRQNQIENLGWYSGMTSDMFALYFHGFKL